MTSKKSPVKKVATKATSSTKVVLGTDPVKKAAALIMKPPVKTTPVTSVKPLTQPKTLPVVKKVVTKPSVKKATPAVKKPVVKKAAAKKKVVKKETITKLSMSSVINSFVQPTSQQSTYKPTMVAKATATEVVDVKKPSKTINIKDVLESIKPVVINHVPEFMKKK